ncbi:hypothetical protein DEA8626_01799 [Defluviimonas aquaemixtae]|uniref:Acid-resistance membrane protein n=1 Tax=Albidovulum aquaemixtae TaxID=1542388 RepID=A0A2R8B6N3_9RHOB|nr:HdeD family acid-resistance protein [Defluviimonas aquaemixtae]SPH18267.1 hypothetical protein DEA8626_01799 [Defluviimonas aquaemixtae]
MTTTTHDTQEREIGRGWFIALGVVLILTGVGALTFPLVATLSMEILVGSAMLAGGIVTLVHAFRTKEWSGFFWELILAAIYLVGGVVFLANPFGGVVALTLMLGVFFTAEGVARMILAFRVRPERAWGWVFASGAMSLLLGILVIAGMANGSSLVFIGLLVGINMIFAGASFIAFGNASGPLAAPNNA